MKKKKLKRKILILEAELSALRHDLGVLARSPESEEAAVIRSRIFFSEDVESAIWAGNANSTPAAFSGIQWSITTKTTDPPL